MTETKTKNNPLDFHLKKDIPIYLFSILLIAFIFCFCFFSNKNSDQKYVEIKYQNRLLYDKDDTNKSTEISFPKEGEKKLTFYKNEANIYFSDIDEFAFLDDKITITIYSDNSIQIKKEDITCSDHVCSNMGRIYQVNTPIVCLPNQIQVMIKTKSNHYPDVVN